MNVAFGSSSETSIGGGTMVLARAGAADFEEVTGLARKGLGSKDADAGVKNDKSVVLVILRFSGLADDMVVGRPEKETDVEIWGRIPDILMLEVYTDVFEFNETRWQRDDEAGNQKSRMKKVECKGRCIQCHL